MNKEELERDLASLKKQREMLVANIQASNGAIEYIEIKLAEIKRKEDIEKETKEE